MARSLDFDKVALWQDRFARFEASEASIAQFCRDEGVSVASFYSWRKKLPTQNRQPHNRHVAANAVLPGRETLSPTFKAVRVLSAGSLTVALVGGTELQIPTDDPQTLELVIQTLVRSDALLAVGGKTC